MRDLRAMSDAELRLMQTRTDGMLSEQAERMAATPKGTRAYAAMAESRPMLIAFRDRVDLEIDRRGL